MGGRFLTLLAVLVTLAVMSWAIRSNRPERVPTVFKPDAHDDAETPDGKRLCKKLQNRELQKLPMLSPPASEPFSASWVPLTVGVEAAMDLGVRAVAICLDGKSVRVRGNIGRLPAPDGRRVFRDALFIDRTENGTHRVEVAFEIEGGALLASRGTFEVLREQIPVRVRVVDGRDQPVIARVVVVDADSGRVVPTGKPRGDLAGYEGGPRDAMSWAGETTLYLPRGNYRLFAARSAFDELGSASVVVDGPQNVRLQVRRAVDLGQRMMVDLHGHSQVTPGSEVPDAIRLGAWAAADLDLVVVADHGAVTDLRPVLADLRGRLAEDELRVAPGVGAEMFLAGDSGPKSDMGRFNALPVVGPRLASLPGRAAARVGSFIEVYRERQRKAPFQGDTKSVFLLLTHPRGTWMRPGDGPERSNFPLFNWSDFEPDKPVARNARLSAKTPGGVDSLAWDGLEVAHRFSWPLYLEVRRDWFSLLSQGRVLTATGSSDTRALLGEFPGWPVTVLDMEVLPRGRMLDSRDFVKRLRDGRAVVSTGPLVDLVVEDEAFSEGKPGQVIVPTGRVRARVKVQSASWVPVQELRLVVNGDVVHQELLPETVAGQPIQHEAVVSIQADKDLWVVAEAGWPLGTPPPNKLPGRYGVVVPGYVPVGFTNPVRVDVDGDGWVAPGL